MKRYDIECPCDRVEIREMPDGWGDWVRFEDAEDALVAAFELNGAQLEYVTDALYAREAELAKLRAVVAAAQAALSGDARCPCDNCAELRSVLHPNALR